MHTAATVRTAAILLLCSMIWLAGCSSDDPTGPDTTTTDPPVTEDPGGDDDPSLPDDPQDPGSEDPTTEWPENLLDETHLTEGSFGWPERDFGRGNAAEIQIFRRSGEPAVDFTLRDMAGEERSLATLLDERPVLLVLGSFT
ncbi:MAG TPA: hypothetical protein VKA86_00850 [Candidatus Krumholzibacteria bacterium]|nr:hypothetical protein [Candidatus Krumholzibacteria bacterium]